MGQFVEFFGPGVAQLSIADRATIANMCPEYGATAAFFPVDEVSIKYLVQTGKCNTRRSRGPFVKLCRTLRIGALPSVSGPWSALGLIRRFFPSLCGVRIIVGISEDVRWAWYGQKKAQILGKPDIYMLVFYEYLFDMKQVILVMVMTVR